MVNESEVNVSRIEQKFAGLVAKRKKTAKKTATSQTNLELIDAEIEDVKDEIENRGLAPQLFKAKPRPGTGWLI